MGLIAIECWRSGQQVSTGVRIDRAGFEAMPNTKRTVHCWECCLDHDWSKRWATFLDGEIAVPAGARINPTTLHVTPDRVPAESASPMVRRTPDQDAFLRGRSSTGWPWLPS